MTGSGHAVLQFLCVFQHDMVRFHMVPFRHACARLKYCRWSGHKQQIWSRVIDRISATSGVLILTRVLFSRGVVVCRPVSSIAMIELRFAGGSCTAILSCVDLSQIGWIDLTQEWSAE